MSKRYAQSASLWTKESATSDGDATHSVASVGFYPGGKFGIGGGNVGISHSSRPADMLLEGRFKGKVAHTVATGIEVQQAIESDALF